MDQKTALHLAYKASNLAIIEDLLKLESETKGSCFAFLTIQDDQGRIPLHSARDDDVVKTLLQYEIGGSPSLPITSGSRMSRMLHWKDDQGRTPIQSNVWEDCSSDLVRFIVSRYTVRPQALDYLYRNAADRALDDALNYPAEDAIHKENLETVRICLENGADPDTKLECCHTALYYAVGSNNIPLAALLLDHGAGFDDCEDMANAIKSAAGLEALEMLDLFYNRGVGIDTIKPEGMTILCLGVMDQRHALVEFALSRGADVRAPQGPFCENILQYAAATGNTKIARLLVDKGADINAAGRLERHETPSGKSMLAECDGVTDSLWLQTPLAVAAWKGKREMAEFLMHQGADDSFLSVHTRTMLDTMLKKQTRERGGTCLAGIFLRKNVNSSKLVLGYRAIAA